MSIHLFFMSEDPNLTPVGTERMGLSVYFYRLLYRL